MAPGKADKQQKRDVMPPRELFWMPAASAEERVPSVAVQPRILAKGPAGLDALQLKERGNEEFKEQRYSHLYDVFIDICVRSSYACSGNRKRSVSCQ